MNIKKLFFGYFLILVSSVCLSMEPNRGYLSYFKDASIGEGLVKLADAIKIASKENGPTLPAAISEASKTLAELAKNTQGPTLPEALIKTAGALQELAKQQEGPTLPQALDRITTTLGQLGKEFSKQEGPTMPQAMMELNKTAQALNLENLQRAHTLISQTIKTGFIASAGLILFTASTVLLYKELTKQQADKEVNPAQPLSLISRVKNAFTNRSLMGTAGIAAGLLLIAKSAAIAQCA